MKKLILIIFILFATNIDFDFAQEQKYTTEIPFIFNDNIIQIEDDLLLLGNDQYKVFNRSEETLLKINEYIEYIKGDYIVVRPENSIKFTIYNKNGAKVIKESYNQIVLTDTDIAFVAFGKWYPPGCFLGKFGAINLKTGKVLIECQYDDINISPDYKYLVATKTVSTSSKKTYEIFTLNGVSLKNSVECVAVSNISENYFKVVNPKTGLYGIIDTNGYVCVPTLYDEIDERVLSGSILVKKGSKWGVSSIDGSGKLLQPLKYQDAKSYSNNIYTLLEKGSITDFAKGMKLVTFYNGDGSLAFSSHEYNLLWGICGDVIYVSRKADNALVGLSKTGEIILKPIPNGSIVNAFSVDRDDDDYICIGGNSANPGKFMVVNRWGDIIAPYYTGDSLSGGSGGKGISLFNNNKNKHICMMADGYKLKLLEYPRLIDYNNGWVLYSTDTEDWITDLNGNILIPKGEYTQLDLYNHKIKDGDGSSSYVRAQNKNGKYGILKLSKTAYEYKPHQWAVKGIEKAVSEGLVPKNLQNDWRGVVTRKEFSRIIASLIQSTNKVNTPKIKFTDTQDPDILLVASLGIIKGLENGKFGPDRPMEREQARAALDRVTQILDIDKEKCIYTIGNRLYPRGCVTKEQAIVTIESLYQEYLKKQSEAH